MLAPARGRLVGLLVGSFLNVVAYRLPRGESRRHAAARAARAASTRSSRTRTCRSSRGCCCAAGAAAAAPIRRATRSSRRPPRLLCAAVTVAVHHDDTAQIALGLVLVRVPGPDHAHRPRAQAHPEQDHRPRRASPRSSPGRRWTPRAARAAPGRRDRRRAAVSCCSRRPGRHGHGRREARGRAGPVPRRARSPRRCSSRSSPGTLVGVVVIARKGSHGGRKTACRSARSWRSVASSRARRHGSVGQLHGHLLTRSCVRRKAAACRGSTRRLAGGGMPTTACRSPVCEPGPPTRPSHRPPGSRVPTLVGLDIEPGHMAIAEVASAGGCTRQACGHRRRSTLTSCATGRWWTPRPSPTRCARCGRRTRASPRRSGSASPTSASSSASSIFRRSRKARSSTPPCGSPLRRRCRCRWSPRSSTTCRWAWSRRPTARAAASSSSPPAAT